MTSEMWHAFVRHFVLQILRSLPPTPPQHLASVPYNSSLCQCWLHCELLAGMEQTGLVLVAHYQGLSICWNAARSGTKSHLYTISQNSLSLWKTVPRFISSKARGSACLPTGSRRWIFSDLENYRGHHHTTLKYSRRSTSWTSRDLEANTSPIQDTNKMSLCHLVILWLPSYSLYALGQTPYDSFLNKRRIKILVS